MVIDEEGVPHGVLMERDATGSKPGRCLIPVPPMTAMRTGSCRRVRIPFAPIGRETDLDICLGDQPFYEIVG